MRFEDFAVRIQRVGPTGDIQRFHVDLLDPLSDSDVRWEVDQQGEGTSLALPKTIKDDTAKAADARGRCEALGVELGRIALPDDPPATWKTHGEATLLERFVTRYHQTRRLGVGIRLRLVLDASDLEGLPWELLRVEGVKASWPELADDVDWTDWLALNRRIALVRTDGTVLREGLFHENVFDGPPINVLVLASGRGIQLQSATSGDAVPFPAMELAATVDRVSRSFDRNRTALLRVVGTRSVLNADQMDRLLKGVLPVHALVSIGHGFLLDESDRLLSDPFPMSTKCRPCVLVKPSGNGGGGYSAARGEVYDLSRLAPSPESSPRLLVLAHCYLSRQARRYLAPGARAVLAMQSQLLAEEGHQIVADTCGSLGAHGSLEDLLISLRQALHARHLLLPEGDALVPAWLAPVLCLNAVSGRLV